MYEKYLCYELADFVCDETFIDWALNPTAESDRFWSTFLDKYPEKQELVSHAKETILTLQENHITRPHVVLDEDRVEIWEQIRSKISTPGPRSVFTKKWLQWAASVAVLLAIGILARQNSGPLKGEAFTYESLIETQRKTDLLEEVTNNTSFSKTIVLPDSSHVKLNPGSRIGYVAQFQGKQRIVYLSGSAEFDVTRDTGKPFLVYSGELVTQVLGTSFYIDASQKKNFIKVTVISGKVSVYPNAQLETGITAADILLTPNQSVTFLKEDLKFTRHLAEAPKPLETLPQPPRSYSNEPVSKIFDDLSATYGIDIVYDPKAMESCRLTSSLSPSGLYDKLEIICESISARYRTEGLRIVIEGPGCP